ncbi:MAG: NAD+ synthase, partial [Elusimicrobia bacterium]|nr:NAD+ synthase [Elusimicrobiota bacterium]
VVGFIDVNESGRGKPLYNAAALLENGKIAAVRHKTLLPTYDVFDEGRYFEPAKENAPVPFRGTKLGLTICEDAWNDAAFWPRRLYPVDPVEGLARAGAELIVNGSSSPYSPGKVATRFSMLRSHARKHKLPVAYCNLIGGNDELVFDGNSMVLDRKGDLVARGPAFAEGLVVADTSVTAAPLDWKQPEDIEEVCEALTLGIRDYAKKTGFEDVLVGLSGGIDSALVAALAARALGPAHVTGVSMPSMHSSEHSVTDAAALAKNLGIKLLSVPIAGLYQAMIGALETATSKTKPGLAEQNLQARLRGLVLMFLSNKTGALLLSTGNKSEMSVGYCTLYGDMNGGLSVISDVPKTTVYALARFLNRETRLIPEGSLTKPPSAELAPNQRDQDDLPEYDVVDRIVQGYVEDAKSPAELVQEGLPADLVQSFLNRIDRAEYKRRQAAPGLKITAKAFGVGRKMPIARGSHRQRTAT